MLFFASIADCLLGENDHTPTISSNKFYLAIMNTIRDDYGPTMPRSDVEDIEFSPSVPAFA